MKRNTLLIFLAFFTLFAAHGQSSQKLYGLGFHVGTIEYNGDLGNDFYKFNDPNLVLGISLSKYMSASWDIEGLLAGGTLAYSPDRKINRFQGNIIDFNLYAKFKFNNGKILKEDAIIAPYLFFGIGDAYYKSSYVSYVKLVPKGYGLDFNFPFGAGVQVRLSENAHLKLQSTFHYSVTDTYDGTREAKTNFNDGFLYNTVGIIFSLGKKDTDKDGIADNKDKCPQTPSKVLVDVNGCALDKDGDGIADYIDKCPEQKGTSSADGCADADLDSIRDDQDACVNAFGPVKFRGCPDSDGDGVPDVYDKCPNLAGTIELKGCSDRDGDGIMDNEDVCPDESGSQAFLGCKDSDGDGIVDKNDKCPSIPGLPVNIGCPEIKEETKKVFEQALRGIQFETGKDIIKKLSYGILNNIVQVMKENPAYKLTIAGHTDNQGDDAKNMALSQSRANSVKAYLIENGIDAMRLTAIGFGESQAVETNDTKEGRAKNRRVEFSVQF